MGTGEQVELEPTLNRTQQLWLGRRQTHRSQSTTGTEIAVPTARNGITAPGSGTADQPIGSG